MINRKDRKGTAEKRKGLPSYALFFAFLCAAFAIFAVYFRLHQSVPQGEVAASLNLLPSTLHLHLRLLLFTFCLSPEQISFETCVYLLPFTILLNTLQYE
jgi:hypothetical protein